MGDANPDGSFTATVSGRRQRDLHIRGGQLSRHRQRPGNRDSEFPHRQRTCKFRLSMPVTKAAVTDYRWTIEEDTTFHNNLDQPTTANPAPSTIAVNFHKSYMPVIATGCVGPNQLRPGTDRRRQPVDRAHPIPRSATLLSIPPSTTTSPSFPAMRPTRSWPATGAPVADATT